MKALIAGIERGYIYFNFDDYSDGDNFFVHHPDKFLKMLIGANCTVTKEAPDYEVQQGEYIVEYWSKNSYGHFARTKEGFNSLQRSNCVNNGEIKSLRVFRIVN